MKNLLKNPLLYILLGIAICTGTYVAHAATVTGPAALFDTILSSPLQTTDSTMYLKTASTTQGDSLSGFQCFTIDTGTPSVEYICGTMSGNTVTGLFRNLDFLTGTTTAPSTIPYHRTGADVRQSDFPALTILGNILGGLDSIGQPIYYSSTVATSTLAQNRANVVSVGLLDDTAFSSAGIINATAAARGVLQNATGLQAASSTALGSSGASLSLTSGISTSTYNAATAPLKVVVTGNSGTIDPNFIGSLATTTTVATYPILQTFLQRQIFSSTGTTTFSVPANVTLFRVQLVAGGGAGDGTTGCNGSGALTTGNGGGAGGYADKVVNLTGTTSVQVFVGSGGTGVTSSTGGSGTWSTFGTNGFYLSATPGLGDLSPGVGVNGDINIAGGPGGTGMTFSPGSGAANITGLSSGTGGTSVFGGGSNGVSGNGNGGTSGNYGGGGSGGSCSNNATTRAGGSGAQGLVIVSW